MRNKTLHELSDAACMEVLGCGYGYCECWHSFDDLKEFYKQVDKNNFLNKEQCIVYCCHLNRNVGYKWFDNEQPPAGLTFCLEVPVPHF